MTGYVYVLSNTSFKKCLKIGMTTRELHERVRELSSKTAVPTPFIVQFAVKCSNPSLLEKEVHRRLRGCRIEKNREFFRTDVYRAVKEIKEALGELHLAVYSTSGPNKDVYLTPAEQLELNKKREAYRIRKERVEYLSKFHIQGYKTLTDVSNKISAGVWKQVSRDIKGYDDDTIHGFFLDLLLFPFMPNVPTMEAEVNKREIARIPQMITAQEIRIIQNYCTANRFAEKEGLKDEVYELIKKQEPQLWRSVAGDYSPDGYGYKIIKYLEERNFTLPTK